MPPIDPLRRSLADLPEELIELIFQSTTSQSSLAAAALTSRQLHRIAQPILIKSVSIFVSSGGEFLKQLDNRRRFQQALMEQPDLASSVKTLKLFHFDPENNGLNFFQEFASSIAELLSSLPHPEVLDVPECLEYDPTPSPIIGTIDLWAYKFSEHYTPIFDWTHFTTPPPACFTWLKVLHVCIIPSFEGHLDPLFRLPNLEHLALHRLSIYDETISGNWSTIQDCPIKSLSLTKLHLDSWPDDNGNLLSTIATVLKHLQTLNITAVLGRGHASVALLAFKQRIPQLSTLEAYRNMEHVPEPRKLLLEDDQVHFQDQDLDDEDTVNGDLDDQDYYDQDLVNRLADEWRNDWLFSALISAPALKVLRFDVTDLHTPVSLKDVPGPLDWNTSMPNLAAYYRDEVFAYASEGAFEDCWNRVQIPLSPAAEEVYLHLRATDMRRYGIGLLHALTQLGRDLPASAPKLRRVGMVVKENNGERDTAVVWREMAGLFRGKGVVLWRVGAVRGFTSSFNQEVHTR